MHNSTNYSSSIFEILKEGTKLYHENEIYDSEGKIIARVCQLHLVSSDNKFCTTILKN